MRNEPIDRNIKRFRREIEAAMIADTDNEEHIARLAQKYDVSPEFVALTIPHMYIEVGMKVVLRRAGCPEAAIQQLIEHVGGIVESAIDQAAIDRIMEERD